MNEQRLHHLLSDSHIYIYDVDLATRKMTFSHSLSHTDHTITVDEYLDMVDESEREDATHHFGGKTTSSPSCDISGTTRERQQPKANSQKP